MDEPEVSRNEHDRLTALLESWAEGEEAAAGELFTLLYKELRAVAARHRRRLGAAETLSTTALVHEAFLKLSPHKRLSLVDRQHFFAMVARAMRQLLVDDARRHGSVKRGGKMVLASLDEGKITADSHRDVELLDLDRSLTQLALLDPRLGEIVELRYFAGLTVDETAELLQLSRRTVLREWKKARLLLHQALSKEKTQPQ